MENEKEIVLRRVKTDSEGNRTDAIIVKKMPMSSTKLDLVSAIEEDAEKLNIPVKLHINILLGIRGECATQKKYNWQKARYTWYTEERYVDGIPF